MVAPGAHSVETEFDLMGTAPFWLVQWDSDDPEPSELEWHAQAVMSVLGVGVELVAADGDGDLSAAKARLINTAIGLVAGATGRLASKAIMSSVISGWSKGSTPKRAIVAKRKIAKLEYKVSRLRIQIRRAATLKKNRTHRDYIRARRAVSLFGDSVAFAITSGANRYRAV